MMVPVSLAVACFALLSPEVLICQDARSGAAVVCQFAPARCETPLHLARGWHGSEKKREEFLNKLKGDRHE